MKNIIFYTRKFSLLLLLAFNLLLFIQCVDDDDNGNDDNENGDDNGDNKISMVVFRFHQRINQLHLLLELLQVLHQHQLLHDVKYYSLSVFH